MDPDETWEKRQRSGRAMRNERRKRRERKERKERTVGSEKRTHKRNGSSNVLENGRGTLIVVGVMTVMPAYVLSLHNSTCIVVVHDWIE